VVDRVLQHAGDGAVVFGRLEQHALTGGNGGLQVPDRRRLLRIVVLVVQGQLGDIELFGHEGRRREPGDGASQSAIG
jgi:hypothetical protein